MFTEINNWKKAFEILNKHERKTEEEARILIPN